MKKIVRNMSDKTGKAFWASAQKTAEAVNAWPAWKKGGIEVRQPGIETASTASNTTIARDSKS